ncbi:MAG: adenosylcobinamide-GDP ribazoletransferase [Hyphomonas sp.]|uniref:adenosylcobinamide-GDP ribazoletransferase n=1 Tax=Hyphomonas sp. TaxID=87 RepID=UPI000C3B8773|nr:adenosylcobinamide-GDP ribazoletransferase [Hyphomonas sp.]MBB40668.1 adenosylcobinamide-GDP ribazoletransferase [Hyphomonas sp.]
MKSEIIKLLLAIQFLTRIPLPGQVGYTPERFEASPAYYPLVGLIIGGVCAGVYWLAALIFPAVIAVLLTLGAGLLLTGAFHEDGLADTFDGIGGGITPEKSLAIMKDSRIGTYGTAALIIVLLPKAAALSSMSSILVIGALLAGHGLSRLSAVLVIMTSRYVRTDGTGKPVAKGLTAKGLATVCLTGLGIILVWQLFLPISTMGYGLIGLAISHVCMRLFFEPKLGGYTGDTLGAVQQASETGFYLGLLAWL